MSESKGQEERDRDAFENWKLMRGKKYATPEEENSRFQSFQHNLRRVIECYDDVPSPPWIDLNNYADMSLDQFKMEILGYNSLEECHMKLSDSESDEEMLAQNHLVKSYDLIRHEDGTSHVEISYLSTTSPRFNHQSDHEKDTKEEKEKDEKEPPFKLQKIDSDDKDKKGGCCSDCGTGTPK